MIIEYIRANEVIVPARKGSLNSDSITDKDPKFAKKFLTGERWSEFANQSKWIIEIILENGITGIGETYRSASKEMIWESMNFITGQNVLKINWRRLPITDQRIYEAFETAVLDIVGQILNVPIYQLLGGSYRDTVPVVSYLSKYITIMPRVDNGYIPCRLGTCVQCDC